MRRKKANPSLAAGWHLYQAPDGGFVVQPQTMQIVTVNRSAQRVLALCDGTRSIAEVVKGVADSFAVPPAQARKSVQAFLAQARQVGHLGAPVPGADPPRVYGDEQHWTPLVLSYELTMRCPLRCSHCYVSAGPPLPDELPLARWLQLLEEGADLGVLRAYLTGGEPLATRGITELLETALAAFPMVDLATSGVGLRRSVLAILAGARNCSVQVSLDGPEAVHNEIRRRSYAYEAATTAMGKLAGAGVFVRAAMTVTPATMPLVAETARLARNAGAHLFRLGIIFPEGRATEDLVLTPAQVDELDGILARAAEELDQPGRFMVAQELEHAECVLPSDKLESEEMNCGAGWLQANVQANGDVTPCLMWRDRLGNVAESPLRDVFAAANVAAYRRMPVPGGAACAGCSLQTECVACPASHLREARGCAWDRVVRVALPDRVPADVIG